MKKAICAIIKNEHLFLKEWLDWHLGVGFDAIHLFEDRGSDSHENITKEYKQVYLKSFETDDGLKKMFSSYESSSRQLVLYNWFGDTYKEEYDWVAFIDIDEFFMFKEEYNLDKLCEEFEPYSAVLLNWKMIGASGHIKRPHCGVLEAYTIEEEIPPKELFYAYKSFCNLRKWKGMSKSLHKANGFVTTEHTENHREHYYNKAWLNHYFTKSWEDWCDRIFNRGGTQKAHRLLVDFFDNNKSMLSIKDILLKGEIHKIPCGTYKIGKGLNTIAGSNVKKIFNLSNIPYIDEYEMIGKKILLIGNKRISKLTKEQESYINSFDVIVRINGMNNIEQTGGRVDWWWLNVWNWEKLCNNIGDKDYSSTKFIFIDKQSTKKANRRSIEMNLPKIVANTPIEYTNQDATSLYDQKEHWEIDKTSTVPTTTVVCLSYLINKFKLSHIYLMCLDIDERKKLLNTHTNWCNTWHKNVGGLEAEYIKKQVELGKLTLIDIDTTNE